MKIKAVSEEKVYHQQNSNILYPEFLSKSLANQERVG